MVQYRGSILQSKLPMTGALKSSCPLSISYYDQHIVIPLLKLCHLRQYNTIKRLTLLFFFCHLFVACDSNLMQFSGSRMTITSSNMLIISSMGTGIYCHCYIFYQSFQIAYVIDFLLLFVFLSCQLDLTHSKKTNCLFLVTVQMLQKQNKDNGI